MGWCGKTLDLHSEHLIIPADSSDFNKADDSSDFEEVDPGANFTYESEARTALQHVLIRFRPIRFPPRTTWHKVELALQPQGGLKHYQHNSFYTPQPLDRPCEISYNDPSDEDIFIKVYTLDAGQHT